ncbi:hypothetical protein AYI68_g508 [Smittium mucronatum]|uniref:Uncharacterized protein n=1 Tax=Smittium mucronatum TaxID=133383 RepID=A0A1R0H866_9FUNG|nr:hypothetical protein AYI68_g508 [Smittium mucronatum]
MESEANSMLIKLTEKVNMLMRERTPEKDIADPFFTTRTPVTDLSVYPKLINAPPSIEEKLFRSPLTKEERKFAIYSCPKTISMNYKPPQLNDSASRKIKKEESTFYGIQKALSQATRSIYYYVHRRIQ